MESPLQEKKVVITTSDGKPFIVPPQGSLGLLALGYVGLIAWRKARRNYNDMLRARKQNNLELPESPETGPDEAENT